MIDKTQVGRRIATLRKKEGLSQAALAERLGISTQAVSKWETGQALPDVDLLIRLSWLFDLSINSLLEGGEAFATLNAVKRQKLSPGMMAALPNRQDQRLFTALASYFSEAELGQLAADRVAGAWSLKLTITATCSEKERTLSLAPEALTEPTLRELAPDLASAAQIALSTADRGLQKLVPLMRCPKCHTGLSLHAQEDGAHLTCEQGHRYPVVDGVVNFGSREIKGEQWSEGLKNYEQYRAEQAYSMTLYAEKGDTALLADALWARIQQRRPRVVADFASGMGFGVQQYLLSRVDWPCLVVLTDVSHRILAWNRQYFEEAYANPYIQLVYLACDCANIPFQEDVLDAVTSFAGFESMQKKYTQGVQEAYRVLKPGACAIHSLATIEGYDSPNSQKWISLLSQDADYLGSGLNDLMITAETFRERSKAIGFASADVTQITPEWPAPDTNTFPYENNVARWMASCAVVNTK